MILLLSLALVLAIAYLVSLEGTRRLDRAYAPAGRLVEVEGGPIHLVERGPGDALPIVLIHGASGNHRDLDLALGDTLAARYRVIAVDRPGQGHSGRLADPIAADPDHQARAIGTALTRIGVEKAVIVGHSFGAAVTAAFAVEFPERVAGLVFVAPATHPWGGGGISWHNRVAALPIVGPVFAALFPYPVGSLAMPSVIKAVFRPSAAPEGYIARIGAALVLRARSFRANAQDVTRLLANVTRLSPRYPTITAPTLIVTGAEDPIVYNHIHAAGLKRDIAGSRRVDVPEAGHMLHWTHGASVIAAIDEVAQASEAFDRHRAGQAADAALCVDQRAMSSSSPMSASP